jgi:alcohol/geraniol dehydrogenase (NADP+)
MIKAYAAYEPGGELKMFEYDPGDLGVNEVEINVHYCGICHSDLSMLDNEWGHSHYPVVAGHEIVGEISKIGAQVKNLTKGQSVGLGWNNGYCNECVPCLSGDQNLCVDAQKTIMGPHGGFADKVRAQSNSVIPIPHGIELETAGPLFCAGIAVFNPLVQLGVKPTDKVAVIGVGGLGHLALQFLKAWGCEVTAFTSSEIKNKEALNMGAHKVLNSRDAKEIESAAEQFNFILSTVSSKLDWNLYISTLKPKGHIHFVGAVLEPLEINLFPMILNQYSVSASPGGGIVTVADMLSFVQRHNIKPIIEKFSFDNVNEAVSRLRNGDIHYRAVLCR